ncbi:unnamed protein product [Penicillium glandicola]
MAESTGLPCSNINIDLEGMSTQTLPRISRRDSKLDIFDTISGDESLKKNYRKIVPETNSGLIGQIFMYKAAGAEDLVFQDCDKWPDCFEKLRTSTTNQGLELCVVTSDTRTLGRMIPTGRKLSLVSYDRIQQVYSVPSQIVIRILQCQWGLSDETMNKITESLAAKEISLPAWQPKLPSHIDTAQIEGFGQPLKFTFQWINAPSYTTDLSVYVFRPYGEHPRVETLDLILTSLQYDQIRRVMVVVNSHNTLADLRRDFLPSQVFHHHASGLPYTMRLFRVMCSKVTDELVAFLKKSCDDINYMVYKGCLHPSGSKMQYLRHLEDCHGVAKDCCQNNQRTLQVLLSQVDLIQGPRTDDETSLINELKMVTKDLDYLHDEIQSSLQRIPGVCRAIREQLDLVQIRRTNILGILAGLYLPLAFVTSFLGMNLNQYTQPQPSWRNATRIDPTNPDKFTISYSKIVDSGANQAWSLQNFFEIAMPLMAGTVLVPLVIGSVIRAVLQVLGRGRPWWKELFTYSIMMLVTMTLKELECPDR